MRVVLLGWCSTASLYLDALDRAGARPVLVVTGSKAPAQGSLATACADLGVSLEHCEDVNEKSFASEVEKLGVDLLLVTGWPRLIGERLRRLPKIGSVNVHPSLLPHYRGKDPIFWAILHGEDRVGVTFHHLTAAIDAGPILLQRPVTVPAGITGEALAARVDHEGAALIPELLAQARSGALAAGAVPAEPGSYFPPVRDEHSLLDWTASADVLERLVRACSGVARAHCFYRGMKLIALEARPAAASNAAPPGTVVAIDGDAIQIATGSAPDGGSSTLCVSRWLFLERVHGGTELAQRIGLVPGTRLSHNAALRG